MGMPAQRSQGAMGRQIRSLQPTIDGKQMKKLIAVTVAGLFALAGAYADEMKKDEKAEAKPAAEAKKETNKADMKKDAKKSDKKKADKKKDDKKKDDTKKDDGKK
jgi:hypothetical protein